MGIDNQSHARGSVGKERGVAEEMSASGIFLPDLSSHRPFIPGLGVRNLACNQTQKIGVVAISKTPSGWLLRWSQPDGRDAKRRLPEVPAKEAQRVAAHVSQEVLSGKGFLPSQKHSLPTVKEAMASTLALSRRRPEVLSDTVRRGEQFLRWLAERHPSVVTFDQLRPFHVEQYVSHMAKRGLAYDSIRLALQPVRMTWRFMSQNYEGIRPLPSVRIPVPPPREIDCLEPSEVRALLGWLEEHEPAFHAMGCLMALCGLRMMEAASLRRQDVDLRHGLITVTETPHHTPKTQSSYRIIPAPSEVIQVLSRWMENQRVIPSDGRLFCTHRGRPWTVEALAHKWSRKPVEAVPGRNSKPGGFLYQAAAALDMPRLNEVAPHRLRSSFVSMASRLGAQESLLASYVGHAPKTVLGTHYRKLTFEELGSIAAIMEGWKTLEDGQSVWKHSGLLKQRNAISD